MIRGLKNLKFAGKDDRWYYFECLSKKSYVSGWFKYQDNLYEASGGNCFNVEDGIYYHKFKARQMMAFSPYNIEKFKQQIKDSKNV